MNYRYGALLNFAPSSFERISDYFLKERMNVFNLLKPIEEKHALIQEEFDIFNPNITFFVGPYQFDKETYSLQMNGEVTIKGNNAPFLFEKEAYVNLYSDYYASHIDSAELTTTYLNDYFLTKEINSHNVLWLYDLSSDEFSFEQNHVFNSFDILPFTIAASIFYRKVDETFPELRVVSHDTTDGNSVISKEVAIREFNIKSSNEIYCKPKKIVGDTFNIDGRNISLYSDIFIKVDTFSFVNGYVFSDKSPSSLKYMDDNFIRNTLENTNEFIVLETTLSQREDKELISYSNFSEVKSILLSKTAEFIDDAYYIENSGGQNALTFKFLHLLLTESLSQFYALQLKLFLEDYDGSGPLSDLIKWIEDKIKELKSKYVKNDECDMPPPNNIDEGCEIECEWIHLDEPHLMVSKQKLKAIVRCSLYCEGVL